MKDQLDIESENITTSIAMVINGDRSSYQTQQNYCRYHLVIPTVPWEPLLMQDSVDCDYFRTPVKFKGSDIYRIVGGISRILMDILRVICDRYPAFKPYFKGHNILMPR